MKNEITLTSGSGDNYRLLIARDNNGELAAYIDDSQDSSAVGEEEIFAGYLDDARNSENGEDALYAAIEAAKIRARRS